MKKLQLNRASGLTLVFMAIVILHLLGSFELSRVARWIPQASLATTLVLLIMQLLLETRSALHHQESPPTGKAGRVMDVQSSVNKRATARAILRISTMVPLLWLFGMAAGAAVFCLVFLRWQADESWKYSLVFSFSLGLLIQVVFTGILQITLYPGVMARFLT